MQPAGKTQSHSIADGGPIGEALDALLDQRAARAWPVSLTSTALAVRQQKIRCDLTDRELADLIAARAIARGHDIVFDIDLLEYH